MDPAMVAYLVIAASCNKVATSIFRGASHILTYHPSETHAVTRNSKNGRARSRRWFPRLLENWKGFDDLRYLPAAVIRPHKKRTCNMTKRRPIEVRIDNFWGQAPHSRLNDLICMFSEPSFDQWNYSVRFEVVLLAITRPLLESMIKFIDLPFAKDPTGTTDEEIKWISVKFDGCRFDQQCTLDDIRRLFLAISHRAAEVWFDRSGDVLSKFLSICNRDDQLEASALRMDHSDELSAERFVQLGDLIQRSVHLKKLFLYLPFMDRAHKVFAALANAIELRQLSILELWRKLDKRKDFGDLVAGENGDGPLIRLLRNPQNHLKELTLRDTGMKDHHLIAVLQRIPSTQIEHLDFSCNLIQMPGMLEFGNLLPKMKSLKVVYFHDNAWEDLPADDRNTIGAALVQGMMENMSIENTYATKRIPQHRLLWHYVALNRAGRRIVQSPEPIADGLWPRILARVGPNVRLWGEKYGYFGIDHNAAANVIYYFLQNCPRILSRG